MNATYELARRAADGDFAPDVRAWLQQAMTDCLGGCPITITASDRLAARNHSIVQAANLLDDGGSTWDTAGRLAREIKRFESDVLPRVRRRSSIPLTDVQAHLLAAHEAAEGRLLRSRERLYALLTQFA